MTSGPRTIEVSYGMLLGLTTDDKVGLARTVSVRIDEEKLKLKLSELEIPIGCILHIERLPDADVHRAVNMGRNVNAPKRVRKSTHRTEQPANRAKLNARRR